MRLFVARCSRRSCSAPLQARTFAGVEIAPPLPAKPVTDTFFGVPVEDPYRFLEDTSDPVVQQWMRGQADAPRPCSRRFPRAMPCSRASRKSMLPSRR